MDVSRAIRARRMVRSFTDEPLERSTLDELCDLARRAPSAGNSQAAAFLILDEPSTVASYWDVTLPEPRRATFKWPGLVAAPALVILAVRPDTYLERYGEADKAGTGLAEGTEAWAVPYWWVDAGAVAQNLLLAVVDAGLGACLFGLFAHERAVAEAFGVPDDWRLVATVAIGHPAPSAPGRSVDRPRRPFDKVRHHNSW